MKKRFLISILLGAMLLCGFALGATSSRDFESISALLAYPITVKYNDAVQTLCNADGEEVFPISYNGTTYLPVRAISNMLGLDVDWDDATKTVLLSDPKTKETSSTVFYKEFPDVPDFGAFAGIKTLDIQRLTSSHAYTYYYSREGVSFEAISGYFELLVKHGFTALGQSISDSSVFLLYSDTVNIAFDIGDSYNDPLSIMIWYDD